ncbi:MAG: FliI/YscN family ATPase [Acidimicrobiia bacterium]|nr:FliI/YscN family ATPase [Acidimicrobiia bacterium]MDH4309679.1 FliI/YscN family ATPase [Acidimicrobiia bacterium]MDH5292226.1 FliI/YscN family ATPase [Acidimicrobiia bacterium]
MVVEGSLARVAGHELEVRGLRLRLGDALEVIGVDGPRLAEVVSVEPEGATALLYGDTAGLGRGDRVRRLDHTPGAVVGPALVGRVVDALGQPLDGGPPILGEAVRLEGTTPPAMERRRIDAPITTGVRLIDTLCTVGKGQRVGIFGGSGVGKSTLLGMLTRGQQADLAVVGLIGERGREVREFIEDELGPEGLERSVVIVATSDQPALLRMRAALYATRVAEWFADQGGDVVLMMDSITRLAMAQREIGLAAGEPPTARGYTPSVFSMLPKILERSGPRPNGTITALYTVLVDGDDMNDPVADAVRGILDGHLVLDRKLAVQGRYPAIDPLASLSRLAQKLWNERQTRVATATRDALAAALEVQELVEVGAYVTGTNPRADKGLRVTPQLVEFLKQRPADLTPAERSWQALSEICSRAELI